MKFLGLLAVVLLASCARRDDEPQRIDSVKVTDTTRVKAASRYILISGATQPGPNCTQVSPGLWSCPAPDQQ